MDILCKVEVDNHVKSECNMNSVNESAMCISYFNGHVGRHIDGHDSPWRVRCGRSEEFRKMDYIALPGERTMCVKYMP